ncbi:MAG: hypothetical protein IH594_10720 [Bacteroidales bacterium]|nr:hypothetical protein [Bacteroidales bacterium]
MHKIEINDRILVPEEGLLIGNGDLSVSIYQNANSIIWRFGKSDVWDRRHDTSEDPEPAHINEIANGILEEGWINTSYNRGEVRSKFGKPISKRAQEICNGAPSYATKPYPCPKPVGELVMNLPMDQKLVSISQVLTIEHAIVNIDLLFESGFNIHLECFIPPDKNMLLVNWHLENWNDTTATGIRPCFFSLYRWADPQIAEFARAWRSNTGSGLYMRWANTELNPLPPPETGKIDSSPLITQRFYPDFDSQEGFQCIMLPVAPGCKIEPVNIEWKKEARLHIIPGLEDLSGRIALAVVTGNTPEEVESQCREYISDTGALVETTMTSLHRKTTETGREFWQRSEIETDDPLFNAIWYENLHAARSNFRKEIAAPGLYLPSTLNDYSPWHGDYHTNYNYQSAFWGRYEANQIDLGDSFFPGIVHMVDLGRELAEKYWDSKGVYFQLLGYPFTIKKDPYGVGSLCRMAYMTGWMANHFWYRYLFTMDTTWLQNVGYPVIRDAAIFYSDFLKKGEDGKFHAFPSGEGEYHYTGNKEDYTDMPQVIRHARYSLQIAADAAIVLNTDSKLIRLWKEIAENIADVDSLCIRGYSEEELYRIYSNSPEFYEIKFHNVESKDDIPGLLQQTLENSVWSSYFGQFPWYLTANIRSGLFQADRDYPVLMEFFKRWRMPNGMFRSMSQNQYGYQGAMAESLGIIGPMSEMLLQSWENKIRIFPAWPKSHDAYYNNLRARGAFLVSSQIKKGKVQYIKITSEKGGNCNIENPWNVKKVNITINGVPSVVEAGKIFTLKTSKDDVIIIKPQYRL